MSLSCPKSTCMCQDRTSANSLIAQPENNDSRWHTETSEEE